MPDDNRDTKLNRRSFLSRTGAAGLGGGLYGLLSGTRPAQAQTQTTDPPSEELTAEQVMEIVKSGQPLMAAYVPPGMMAAEQTNTAESISTPNILIIMVDQLRWFKSVVSGDQTDVATYLPNLTALQNNSFVFTKYCTAGNMCTPARASLLTGLYPLQTFQLMTEGNDGVPPLNSDFPTFGSALNDSEVTTDYADSVRWFGKWHLGGVTNNNDLSDYGFQTRTYPSSTSPSPNGWYNEGVNGGWWPPTGCDRPDGCGPGQATGDRYYASDADIVGDFVGWISNSHSSPWCAVVSLINPHDIGGYPKWILDSTNYAGDCPTHGSNPNFKPYDGALATLYDAEIDIPNAEGDEDCSAKPTLYHVYKGKRDSAQGAVTDWGNFLNWYFTLQKQIDNLIGDITSPTDPTTILGAVNAYDSLDNTIVIFTSDHGEYAGAHGLHGKGAGVYEEGIHVPLFVSYPGYRTGIAIPRQQLCSSVDFFPLVVELATNSGGWRSLDQYAHLADRQSLAFYLGNPNVTETRIAVFGSGTEAAYRPYILHTTDEIWALEYEIDLTQFGETTPPKSPVSLRELRSRIT